MKRTGKAAVIAAIVGAMTLGTVAYADGLKTPAQIVSELTGKPVAELYTERQSGKTYGTIAKEAGKLDAFQKQVLEQKKTILDQRVKDGRMTQAQADAVYTAIKDNQATCDGTGSKRIGAGSGVGFGNGGGGCGIGGGFGGGNGMGMHRGVQ